MPNDDDRQLAQDVIDAVTADRDGPYFDADDPRHTRAVEEMRKLHEIVHGEASHRVPRAVPRGGAEPDRDQAQEMIAAVLRDAAHPYFDDEHPDHAGAVEDMKRLFRIACQDTAPD